MNRVINLANGLTLINLLCGIVASWLAFNANFSGAVALVVIGAIADLLDGRVARKTGSDVAMFGAYFDDMADFVSFGVAPMFVIMAYSQWSNAGFVFGIAYCVAVAIRLWHFTRNKGVTPAGFFAGVPSPAGAAIVGAAILIGWPTEAVLISTGVSIGLMLTFGRNWPHFNYIFHGGNDCIVLNMILFTIGAAVSTVLFGAITVPLGLIIVYLLSPLWQKPNRKETIKTAT